VYRREVPASEPSGVPIKVADQVIIPLPKIAFTVRRAAAAGSLAETAPG